MNANSFSGGVKEMRIHMVGIKGVGMTALAEILMQKGARLSGSDTGEKFFTDAILEKLGITVTERFKSDTIKDDIQLVIYSAAYPLSNHPELATACEKQIPCLSYPEALGALSTLYDSTGVCGVHGKTTTTAMTGILLKELKMPATILVGSQVPGFGERSTFSGGERYFIAETCEYKRHFLHFEPARLIMTSIEADHQDYFKTIDDIENAFFEFAMKLRENGVLIYCADDPGVNRVIERVFSRRRDISGIPYGFSAEGPYGITGSHSGGGVTIFTLRGDHERYTLCIPGAHSVLNAAAALALAYGITRLEKGAVADADRRAAVKALSNFKGTRRRSEIIGKAAGILFMDDYAHHPTAIQKTLDGIREFYPQRRLIVDFMSHTYSRTQSLLKEFAASFSAADEVILHKIYASARENMDGKISGDILFQETRKKHQSVLYYEEVMDAFDYLKDHLARGDLFITMGAGDNWKLCHELYREKSMRVDRE